MTSDFPSALPSSRASGLTPPERENLSNSFFFVLLGAVAAISLTRLYNYLLFHAAVETFSILVAWSIFLLAWNARRFLDNHYLLLLGIGWLFAGAIDFVHMLSYRGMGILGTNSDLPTQFWIAGQYVQSAAFLAAPIFLKRRLNVGLAFAVFGAGSVLLAAAIWTGVFPSCFSEETGLTPFKVYSEYVITAALIGSAYFLYRRRSLLDPATFRLLTASILLTAIGELTFTLYIDVYGALNMAGHLLRFASFCLVYHAILVTGIVRPNALLFRSLALSEDALRKTNDQLERALSALRETEERYRAFVGSSSESIWRVEFEPSIPTHLAPADQIRRMLTASRLAESNLVFARMCGRRRSEEMAGAPLSQLAFGAKQRLEALISSGYRLEEVEMEEEGSEGPRWITGSVTGVVEHGALLRIWGVQLDVTEARRVRLERERAMAEVTRLSGLLPICARCKKIRDDQGYWNQVEAYLAARSEVSFTHGICPDCAGSYLEDFYRDAGAR